METKTKKQTIVKKLGQQTSKKLSKIGQYWQSGNVINCDYDMRAVMK